MGASLTGIQVGKKTENHDPRCIVRCKLNGIFSSVSAGGNKQTRFNISLLPQFNRIVFKSWQRKTTAPPCY